MWLKVSSVCEWIRWANGSSKLLTTDSSQFRDGFGDQKFAATTPIQDAVKGGTILARSRSSSILTANFSQGLRMVLLRPTYRLPPRLTIKVYCHVLGTSSEGLRSSIGPQKKHTD